MAKRPASAIGGHHDDRTEDHPREGWTAGACQPFGQLSRRRLRLIMANILSTFYRLGKTSTPAA